MRGYIIAGTESEAEISFAQKQLGLDSYQLWLLARPNNLLSQSAKYESRTIIIRYPGETRKGQFARLFRLLRGFERGLYFWRTTRRPLVNLAGLALVFLVAGMQGRIVLEGKIYEIGGFVIKRLSVPSRVLGLIEFLTLTAAFLATTTHFFAQYLRKGWARSRLWLQMAFCCLSPDVVAFFCAQASAQYFRYERQIYSGRSVEVWLGCSRLGLWAGWSLLFTCFYYPLLLLGIPFKGRLKERRVLFSSHESRLNGAPRSLLMILRELDRTEFEPFIVSASEGLLTSQARVLGVPVIILPISQLLTQSPGRHLGIHAARFLISLRYLLAVLATLRIQIAHTNVLVTPDLAIAAKMSGIISLWHFRECIGETAWAKFQVRMLNTFSDRVLCNSEYSRGVLNSQGVFWPKMVTVRNAIDGEQFQSKNHGGAFRRSQGACAADILVGCAGQITPVKGQETFVRAAVEVARKFEHVKFVMIGSMDNGAFVDRLARIITEAKLSERIRFCGYRTDMEDVMAGLDIHVTPSHWPEPFGRVALEAMAAGAVSVVSKVGGLPEIVLDRVTGLHFEPGSVEGLVSMLTRLIGDASLRQRLGKAGILRVKEEFSVDGYIETIENTYRYPKCTVARISQTRGWRALQKWLPARLRSHPKLLVYYPFLFLAVAVVWLLSFPLFVASLPFAVVFGWWNRRRATQWNVGVFAYQTVRNAATRFRIATLFERIAARGVHVQIYYPSSDRLADRVYVSLFYGHQPHVKDLYYYVVVFLNRLVGILRCYSNRCIILQYELFHEGPMWMELFLAYTHPRVIYDYDDSLYAFPRYAKYLPRLFKAVDHVVAGNSYLARYAEKYNSRVTVIPTCPALRTLPAARSAEGSSVAHPVRIGWIGNPANLVYLTIVAPVIRRLGREIPVTLIIISAGPYSLEELTLEGLPVRRVEWSLERESSDILAFDVGIMPVHKDIVGEGKCGFKALQYMAAGIPCVISPVGINSSIVEHGRTGYLAETEEEWYENLKMLAESRELRRAVGERAKRFVLKNYNPEFCVVNWVKILGYDGNFLCAGNNFSEAT
jgi:glycosyltransferase involved in cell wall biosynthesis